MTASLDIEVPDTFNMATVLVDRHVAEGRGERVAIYFRDQAITYTELLQRVNRAGHLFDNRNIFNGFRNLGIVGACREYANDDVSVFIDPG